MCGKEANNRKQEIDRQHHTIPSNGNTLEKFSVLWYTTTNNLNSGNLANRHFIADMFRKCMFFFIKSISCGNV